LVREQTAEDGLTHKVLLRLHDGQQIETVLMRYPESGDSQGRATVCVSTQAGCAVGCPFCATGRMGLLRNLSPGEIVGQVIFFARRCQVTNVVFMGMGEPLLNYDNTWRAIETLNHPRGFGLGARRMTISTSGIVPGIQRLAGEKLQVNLAISLHAPNDRLRNILVPVNRKYPIAALMQACKDYVEKTGRRVSYEYVLLAGVNDTPKLAHELGALLRGTLSHVNLIPLNPTASAFTRPRHESVLAFQRVVRTYGIATTVRIERGVEISAACGQLTVAGPAAT
jgi:23S rRNA (adenine2503-C2)-methyltransferase